MTPKLITTVGLIFDILGVCVLFKFGFPQPDFNENTRISWDGVDDSDVARRRFYFSMSIIGLLLLIGGFGLQIVALWIFV